MFLVGKFDNTQPDMYFTRIFGGMDINVSFNHLCSERLCYFYYIIFYVVIIGIIEING